MDEHNKLICDAIFKFIQEQLEELLDTEIFLKSSFKDLGEFYYNSIINRVNGATVDLVNAVVRTIGLTENLKCQDDYYKEITNILGFQRLPSKTIADVRKEYDEIFVTKYDNVSMKYQTEINRLGNELFRIKSASDAIKNGSPTYSVMYDISADENRLYELATECNFLRTRKEMLECAFTYVNTILNEFCDMDNPTSVETSISMLAIRTSKKKNEAIRNGIFYTYKNCLEILEDDIDRDYMLFFKVKLYTIIEKANKKYHEMIYTSTDKEAIDFYKEYTEKIPKIDDLNSWKTSDNTKYQESLNTLISNYGLLDDLIDIINSSVCLRKRKTVLIKAIELFQQGEFEVFNNIIPVQVEGIFADYLRDTTTFSRFTHMNIYENAVLKDKIMILKSANNDIYPEATEYFMYYFNNIIRNRIAHGRYYHSQIEADDEIFSKELILDLCLLVHMITRKSETEKMYRFVHGYQEYYKKLIKSEEHPTFGALFNDIIGQKIISDYDTIESYRPLQVVYWLVNPYYEKIYEQIEDKSDLLSLREKFLSKEFWEYVLSRLTEVEKRGYDYLGINKEFSSIVKAMFRCNIDNDTKTVLIKVNSILNEIRDLQ